MGEAAVALKPQGTTETEPAQVAPALPAWADYLPVAVKIVRQVIDDCRYLDEPVGSSRVRLWPGSNSTHGSGWDYTREQSAAACSLCSHLMRLGTPGEGLWSEAAHGATDVEPEFCELVEAVERLARLTWGDDQWLPATARWTRVLRSVDVRPAREVF